MGAFAAYGYLKSPDDKNQLVVDDYAAEVVRDIFRWKLEGMSQQGIADRLKDGWEIDVRGAALYRTDRGIELMWDGSKNGRFVPERDAG